MICNSCGQYYPDDEKRCPWCNSSDGLKTRGELKAVSAVLVRVYPRDKTVRGLVGYAIGGMLGGMLGIMSGKNNAVFWVTYHTGHTGKETVKVGSRRYKELAALTL